jgi:hypothetical protein
MSDAISLLAHAVVIGSGATALMDVLDRGASPVAQGSHAGLRTRRTLASLPARGRWRHDPIASTPSLPGECTVGWIAHYLTGIAFAAVLVAFGGSAWIEQPTIAPAMAVGVGSVVAPFFLLQPALGAGVAGSRTARPAMARLHSLMTHAIFGLGLYASAWMTSLLAQGG